jgi:hypothetical protein
MEERQESEKGAPLIFLIQNDLTLKVAIIDK